MPPNADDDLCPKPANWPTLLKSHFLYANFEATTGQIYSVPTSSFLTPPAAGNSDMLVILYDHDSNSIHVQPMKNCTSP
jgi:hypothetical protein